MCIFWGPEGACLYNEGFRQSVGSERHPASIGRPVREVWAEVWPYVGAQIEDAMAGGRATWQENALVPITRDGRHEEVYWTYSYSPIDDDTAPNGVGGVLVVCSDTTRTVLAERAAKHEGKRFAQLFEQAPTFMTVLRGPTHIFEYCNPGYMQLLGHRNLIGKPVAQAVPEAEGQGYLELLDGVYRSGTAFSARDMRIELQRVPGGPLDERYLDFVYQPIVEEDGTISGIFVEGVDVTERHQGDVLQNALARLSEEIRDLDTPPDIGFAAARILGEALGASRAGFGAIDMASRRYVAQPAWQAPGLATPGDKIDMRGFASYLDTLARGEVIRVNDVATNPLTRDHLEVIRSRHANAFVNVPVIERTGLVAIVYVSSLTVRDWSDEDIALIREVGERTQNAIERLNAAAELRKSEEQLRLANATLEQKVRERTAERNLLATVFESTDSLINVLDLDYRWLAINKAGVDEFARVFGRSPKVGDHMLDLLDDQPAQRAAVEAVWSRALAGEEFTAIGEFGELDRARDTYEMKFNTLYDDAGHRIGAYQVMTNINDRVAAQKELLSTQEALRQSQKMEAVGHLTGGIAHDFNNMLAVVSGSLELLNRRIGESDARAKHYINSATEGAKRATNLTQRLLVFARQQPLQPEAINANRLVSGMTDLLTHALGASIQLETVHGAGLWMVHADLNQLESVLLNLCVNARDAMPDGGRLTIETQNACLDDRYVASEPGVTAGQYVMIGVTDTGSGMSEEVVAKAFDPFFTTKEVGKGTGLGLSQVYGFVKQSGGHVKIYSEAGHGTAVKIYLPRMLGVAGVEEQADDPGEALIGDDQEVILVVDDEAIVRRFSVDALTELGYRVIEADGAKMALRLLEAHPEIMLMFTDIVMPETNGQKLAEEVNTRFPDVKILYTTGYTPNAVVHNGVVERGVELIGKPYTLNELAAKVRAILDKA